MVEDYYGYAGGLDCEFKVVITGFVLFCFFLNERRLSYNMVVSCHRRINPYPCHFRLFELSLLLAPILLAGSPVISYDFLSQASLCSSEFPLSSLYQLPVELNTLRNYHEPTGLFRI